VNQLRQDSYFDVKVVFNPPPRQMPDAAITIPLRPSPVRKELCMAGVKLVVMYPRPKDIDLFEKLYQTEHIPMAVQKLAGKTRLVATRVHGSPQGTPAFHRIAEVHFPSMEALQACAASPGGIETLAHATAISSGGPPVLLIAEEASFDF
jgi:uncharacterized protein (TIGR02118 family)